MDAVNHRGSANGINSIRGNWTLLDADTDFDGLLNSYENAHGLDQNNPADAATDLDGDGMTNFAEYLAGTDPQLATSLLRVTSVNRAPTTCTVHFDAIAQKKYRLEYKAALTDAEWLMLPIADFVSPTTGNQQIIDTTATGTKRFYRLRIIFP